MSGTRRVQSVKYRYPLDRLTPVAGLHGFGFAGPAVGGGEGAVFFGGVVAGGMDADDFAVD